METDSGAWGRALGPGHGPGSRLRQVCARQAAAAVPPTHVLSCSPGTWGATGKALPRPEAARRPQPAASRSRRNSQVLLLRRRPRRAPGPLLLRRRGDGPGGWAAPVRPGGAVLKAGAADGEVFVGDDGRAAAGPAVPGRSARRGQLPRERGEACGGQRASGRPTLSRRARGGGPGVQGRWGRRGGGRGCGLCGGRGEASGATVRPGQGAAVRVGPGQRAQVTEGER